VPQQVIYVNPNAKEHIQENPLDTLLANYARGWLSPPMHVLVACHLVYQPSSRKFVRSIEELGGSELLEQVPIELHDRDERLARIFALDDKDALSGGLHPIQRPRLADDILPHPLSRYLGCTISDVPWRTLLPGVKEYRIEENEDGEASLFWIKKGRKIPSHTHEGSEFTLVLKGAFSDKNGRYAEGDISIADMDVDHCPVADEAEDCFCFAVTDAPLQLTGPIGRIVQRFFKKH